MLPVWVTLQLTIFGYFIAVIVSFFVAYKSDKAYKKSINDFIKIHAPLDLFVVENDQTRGPVKTQQSPPQKKTIVRQNLMANYTQKTGYSKQNKAKPTLLLTNGHQNHSAKSDYEEYDDEESGRSTQKKPLFSLIKPTPKKKLINSSSSSTTTTSSSSSTSENEDSTPNNVQTLIVSPATDGYNYMADLYKMINEKNKKETGSVVELMDDDDDDKENGVVKKIYKKSTSIWGYPTNKPKNSRVMNL